MALTPIGMVRKLGKLIRGGVTPGQVFLGCLLGFVLGMIPGFNGSMLLVVLLLVLLNANGAMAMLCFALGKVLCILLAPVTFQIGYFLIHQAGLEGLFRAAGDTPGVALMDLHYYCVAGGLLVGLLGGAVLGVLVGNVIRGTRKMILAAGERSEKAQRIAAKGPVRLLLRLVFGKQKAGFAEMLDKRSPVFRKAGVVLCAVLIALAVVGQIVLTDLFFEDALRGGLAAAVGAEVNIERADLSLFGEGLEIEGLQITDPGKPTHNLFQAKRLAGDVSVSGLLTKRLIVNRLVIDDAQTDAKRAAPGEVFEKEPRPEPEAPDDALSEYFEKAKELREWFEKLKEYLDKRDANEADEQPTPEEIEQRKRRLRDLARAEGYFALSAQEILSQRPAWVIRELNVKPLRAPHVPDPMAVHGEELSGAPQLHDKPLKLVVTAGDKTLVSTSLNFDTPGGEHHVSLHTPPLPVGDVGLSNKAGLDVSEGTAEIQVDDGVFTNRLIRKLPFAVKLRDLKAGSREGKGVLGLDATATSEAMKHLKQIDLAGSLEGRLDAPRLKLDEKAILGALKDALVGAGKAELARQADAQLKKLTSGLAEKAGGEAGKVIGDTAGGLLKGILPGGDKKQDPNAGKKKPGGGLLDGILPGGAKKQDPNAGKKKPGGGLLDGLLK